MFMGNSFDICIEGASVADCTSFVHGLVYVMNYNGGGEFLGGKLVFPDKLPIYTRDVGTRVYQCGGVNYF